MQVEQVMGSTWLPAMADRQAGCKTPNTARKFERVMHADDARCMQMMHAHARCHVAWQHRAIPFILVHHAAAASAALCMDSW
jgi:hypothetical protein